MWRLFTAMKTLRLLFSLLWSEEGSLASCSKGPFNSFTPHIYAGCFLFTYMRLVGLIIKFWGAGIGVRCQLHIWHYALILCSLTSPHLSSLSCAICIFWYTHNNLSWHLKDGSKCDFKASLVQMKWWSNRFSVLFWRSQSSLQALTHPSSPYLDEK